MTLSELILYAQALSTGVMFGLIWFVQVVHYPLFRRVGSDEFLRYEREHQSRTTLVVGPAMLVELASAGAMVAMPAFESVRTLAVVGLVLVGVNWISTAALQVPMHRRLEHVYDDRTVRLLVATNWIRTGAWTVRMVLVLMMFGELT